MSDLKSIEKAQMSERFPWLFASEVEAKYRKGVHGKTSDRWLAAPKYTPCCKGNYREWHIENPSSQTQCYCRYWRRFINANLGACFRCAEQAWPEAELYRVHLLPGATKEQQEAAVLKAVTDGRLTEKEAIDLGETFELGRASEASL